MLKVTCSKLTTETAEQGVTYVKYIESCNKDSSATPLTLLCCLYG